MKKQQYSKSVITLLLLSIILSACGLLGASNTASSDGYYEDYALSEGPEAVFVGAADEAAFAPQEAEARVSNQSVSAERLVIKNANISVVVDDPAEAMDDLAALAESMGGFVVSSNLFQSISAGGLEVPSASITIRVPAENLQDTLDLIEAESIRVVSQSQSGQDVTAQYTDLQSRLRNLEDAEMLLRDIMEDADDTEDVLNAFYQLNGITEQIEVLKGQIQYYEESAALSAISVQLIASAADQPITIGGWEPVGVAKDAIQSLVNALQSLVDFLIYFVLYLLPVLLIIGIPLWLIVRALRKRWGKKKNS